MTAFPAASYISNNARIEAEVKQALEDIIAAAKELPGGKAETTLTIASGVITPVGAVHLVDTQAAAASDDLDFIDQTNHPDGRMLVISTVAGARDVVVRHNQTGTGKIMLADGVNFTLDDPSMYLLLKRVSTTWVEIDRSYGNKFTLARAHLGLSPAVDVRSGAGALTQADNGQTIDCTGTFTLTIDALSTLDSDWKIVIRNSGTGAITLDPNSTETINGATTLIIYPGEVVNIVKGATEFEAWTAGRINWRVVQRTTTTNVVLADHHTIYEATSGTWSLTLPALSTVPDGFIIGFRNSGTGVITLDPDGSETINGVTSTTVSQGNSFLIVKSSGAWVTIGSTNVVAGWRLFERDDVSTGSPASASVTNLETDELMIVLKGVSTNGTSPLNIEVSVNNGSTYNAITFTTIGLEARSSSNAIFNTSTTTPMDITGSLIAGSTYNILIIIRGLKMQDANSVKTIELKSQGNNVIYIHAHGYINTTSVINAVRINAPGDTFDAGEVLWFVR